VCWASAPPPAEISTPPLSPGSDSASSLSSPAHPRSDSAFASVPAGAIITARESTVATS
jgi:hypothetical protein